jgi:hypothetical protein
MPRPAPIADTKKSSGSSGDHHRPWSFPGTIRYRLPREDWCSVESTTPAITSGVVMVRSSRRGASRPNASKTTGENSRIRTVV